MTRYTLTHALIKHTEGERERETERRRKGEGEGEREGGIERKREERGREGG